MSFSLFRLKFAPWEEVNCENWIWATANKRSIVKKLASWEILFLYFPLLFASFHSAVIIPSKWSNGGMESESPLLNWNTAERDCKSSTLISTFQFAPIYLNWLYFSSAPFLKINPFPLVSLGNSGSIPLCPARVMHVFNPLVAPYPSVSSPLRVNGIWPISWRVFCCNLPLINPPDLQRHLFHFHPADLWQNNLWPERSLVNDVPLA